MTFSPSELISGVNWIGKIQLGQNKNAYHKGKRK